MLHHLPVDTDLEPSEFNVVDTNTTLNSDSNVPIVFDVPKRTPKRSSEDISRHDEPRLYMSNDFYISSVLHSNSYSCSYRDEEEKQNSLRVLGKPKCWTDSIINSDGEVDLSERDSDGWTMLTPIRNIGKKSIVKKTSSLDTFDNVEVEDGNKFTLIDMFKNLCIAAKRVTLRGGVLLFQPVSNLIQRMTRHRFSLIELRQILYISPDLVSVRWIRINSEHKKLYPKEYSNLSGDLIFDLKISLKVDGIPCIGSSDFNKALEIFTKLVQKYDNEALESKKEPELLSKDVENNTNNTSDIEQNGTNFAYPMADLPPKPSSTRGKLLDILKTPTKSRGYNSRSDAAQCDHSPSRLSSSSRLSSLRANFELKCRYNDKDLPEHTDNTTPGKFVFETPKRPQNDTNNSTNSIDDKIRLESPNSNVKLELLDTPGMKRIKLAALRREMANKQSGQNIVFQLDTRWLVELIYEMVINEEMTHVISLRALHDFIANRSQSSVSMSRLVKILEQLHNNHPDVFSLSNSTIDGNCTVTLNKECINDPKILQNIARAS